LDDEDIVRLFQERSLVEENLPVLLELEASPDIGLVFIRQGSACFKRGKYP
jgi:hypothetical protein